jgi:hypothetical protein
MQLLIRIRNERQLLHRRPHEIRQVLIGRKKAILHDGGHRHFIIDLAQVAIVALHVGWQLAIAIGGRRS